MKDLYDHDLTGAAWTRPCGGNVGQEGEDEGSSCVETATLPGGGVAVRDSKRPDLPALRFTAPEWAAFTATL
jgi:hypothetical protein